MVNTKSGLSRWHMCEDHFMVCLSTLSEHPFPWVRRIFIWFLAFSVAAVQTYLSEDHKTTSYFVHIARLSTVPFGRLLSFGWRIIITYRTPKGENIVNWIWSSQGLWRSALSPAQVAGFHAVLVTEFGVKIANLSSPVHIISSLTPPNVYALGVVPVVCV